MEGLVRAIEETMMDVEWMQVRAKEIRMIGGIGVAKIGAGKAKACFKKWELEAAWLDQLADEDRVDGGVIIQPSVSKVVPLQIEVKTQISYFCRPLVGESVFVLEDGVTFMSLREALMWFDVTPFSPLKTHQRLSVY
jgi:hypothetical protein